MVRKGTAFTFFGKPIEIFSFFEGAKLLYFTDTTFGNFLLHTHNNVEVILVLNGNVEMLIGNKRYHVPQGSLISIPPQIPHYTIIPSGMDRYERMVLHIFPEYLESLLIWCGLPTDQFHFLFDVQLLEATPENLWIFRTFFERAFYIRSQNEKYQKSVFPCLLMEIFMELELRLKNQKKPPIPVTNNLVTTVVNYIDEHFSNPDLTIEDIRRSVYVSQGYLSRVFKAYTGTSLYNFLISKRLLYAKELLASGSSVLDSCLMCGFSDYTCFLKAFKKHYDMTPSQFRRQSVKKPHS